MLRKLIKKKGDEAPSSIQKAFDFNHFVCTDIPVYMYTDRGGSGIATDVR